MGRFVPNQTQLDYFKWGRFKPTVDSKGTLDQTNHAPSGVKGVSVGIEFVVKD